MTYGFYSSADAKCVSYTAIDLASNDAKTVYCGSVGRQSRFAKPLQGGCRSSRLFNLVWIQCSVVYINNFMAQQTVLIMPGLQFRSRIQTRSDSLLAIPYKGAQGEELFPVDHHERTSLMWKVHEFLNVEAVGKVVSQYSTARSRGLTNQVPRSWLVEEHVMHESRPPCRDSVWTSESDVPNERVSAAVIRR